MVSELHNSCLQSWQSTFQTSVYLLPYLFQVAYPSSVCLWVRFSSPSLCAFMYVLFSQPDTCVEEWNGPKMLCFLRLLHGFDCSLQEGELKPQWEEYILRVVTSTDNWKLQLIEICLVIECSLKTVFARNPNLVKTPWSIWSLHWDCIKGGNPNPVNWCVVCAAFCEWDSSALWRITPFDLHEDWTCDMLLRFIWIPMTEDHWWRLTLSSTAWR